MYLSHIDGFSDVDPNAISSKYSMYMLANTGNNGEPLASLSSCRYISDPIPKYVVSTRKVNISIRLSIGIQMLTESEQATTVDSIKDVFRSSVKVPEFDKDLKKAGDISAEALWK